MDIDTATDTVIFFGKKPTETYRTLNCQYLNNNTKNIAICSEKMLTLIFLELQLINFNSKTPPTLVIG